MINPANKFNPLAKVKQDIQKKKRAISPGKRPFPVHVLPAPVRELIYSFEEANGFNIEFQAGAILGVFAGIAGNAYRLRVKPGWTEPCILWIPVVGHASSLKTPVLKTYLRPIWSMEKRWHDQHKISIAEWERGIEDKTIPPDEPKPLQRELLVGSATIEAIFKIHEANRNGLLMFRDELLGWVSSMNQYRRGAGDDQETWLSMYNNEPLKISRATKDAQFIAKAAVSVLGGIQPAVLPSLTSTAKDGNGFTYRLSFIYPDNVSTPKWSNREVDSTLFQQYENAVGQLLSHPPQDDHDMSMSLEASTIFIDWFNMNQELCDLADDDMRRSIYSKMIAQCLRIAMLMKVIKRAYGLAHDKIVDAECVHSAIEIAEYFRYTSIKAHSVLIKSDNKVERAADMYVEDNMSIREIAERLGISKSQIGRWKKASPDMFDRSKKSES